jgi:hypothetical protein
VPRRSGGGQAVQPSVSRLPGVQASTCPTQSVEKHHCGKEGKQQKPFFLTKRKIVSPSCPWETPRNPVRDPATDPISEVQQSIRPGLQASRPLGLQASRPPGLQASRPPGLHVKVWENAFVGGQGNHKKLLFLYSEKDGIPLFQMPFPS